MTDSPRIDINLLMTDSQVIRTRRTDTLTRMMMMIDTSTIVHGTERVNTTLRDTRVKITIEGKCSTIIFRIQQISFRSVSLFLTMMEHI